ncbi:NlpC/P60 family protein [Polaribacter sp. R77954]|uniref:C40 family peptidase n=1 Tax=Polaribacter sp. R77954 TaxID=3093870 RepID=UPI0037C947BD
MHFHKTLLLICILCCISCNNNSLLVSGLQSVNQDIQAQYAPDKRVAIYNIEIENINDKIVATGKTNSQQGYQKLLDSLQSLDVDFSNKIRVLPDSAVGQKIFAIARNSVINIRSKPKHSAELGTQGLLGMPLKIYDKKGDFYRVQTPDHYISWVDKGGITRMTKEEFTAWNTSKKVMYTQNFGYVYKDLKFKEIVSDITLGGVLILLQNEKEYYFVQFPDERKGYIRKEEAMIYEAWLQSNSFYKDTEISQTQKNIEHYAKEMLGFPYLWGGTSSKGMDCSGFTKMVYLMNGFIIPRDASQQVLAGQIVDAALKFEGLEKGDLLFFGKKATANKKQKVTHVGIWLGNAKMEFIHASGNVHLSSMDEKQPHYDAFNKNRYLGSRRYLGVDDQMIVKFSDTSILY